MVTLKGRSSVQQMESVLRRFHRTFTVEFSCGYWRFIDGPESTLVSWEGFSRGGGLHRRLRTGL